jgi:hypothetical protein
MFITALNNYSDILQNNKLNLSTLVFRPDDLGTVHRSDLYIEDFFARDLVTRPHPNLTKLIMVMSTPGTSPNPSNRSIEHFYARAAKNLKRAVPDLQVLVLRGGYRFYPQTKGVSFLVVQRVLKVY